MEVEYDSDEDTQDIGNELNTWLAQLNEHQVGASTVSSSGSNSVLASMRLTRKSKLNCNAICF